MAKRFFNARRKPEDVAYDLALVLASKEEGANTPYELLRKMIRLYPECLEVAKEVEDSEKPDSIGKIDVKFP
ncbi:hypothetical protein ACI0ZV_001425 [Cronobacter sakazakii]|uniref:hypothetical protein n=1 Tax=Cronobacter TaxID=413496 RepID=UPI001376082C|nr:MULTISPECIES: hypothetical protein [Cronobacter]ELY6216435.1 hypothetical protein [Cronobacter sakazakii]MDT3665472.1 hypothetical protein [Cronobacter dublinensis]NCI09088.1 hypothetical protein [Cronobacter sakazakii]